GFAEPINQPGHRRFSRAISANDSNPMFCEIQIDIAEHWSVIKGDVDVFELDGWHYTVLFLRAMRSGNAAWTPKAMMMEITIFALSGTRKGICAANAGASSNPERSIRPMEPHTYCTAKPAMAATMSVMAMPPLLRGAR